MYPRLEANTVLTALDTDINVRILMENVSVIYTYSDRDKS